MALWLWIVNGFLWVAAFLLLMVGIRFLIDGLDYLIRLFIATKGESENLKFAVDFKRLQSFVDFMWKKWWTKHWLIHYPKPEDRRLYRETAGHGATVFLVLSATAFAFAAVLVTLSGVLIALFDPASP